MACDVEKLLNWIQKIEIVAGHSTNRQQRKSECEFEVEQQEHNDQAHKETWEGSQKERPHTNRNVWEFILS